MGNGNSGAIPAIILLVIFMTPLALIYLWPMLKEWAEKEDSKHLSKYPYVNKHKEDKKEIYFKKSDKLDREHPPNASFFSRVDGKETFIEGPYEEQWLNRYEKIKWKYKKKKGELKKKIY